MNDVKTTPRLTSLSHGGGCGCKIAPGVLQQIISKSGAAMLPKELLVGIETADDAAVYQINDTQAIVATTDFFMPIVDDPFDFGRIAATNAISDVYAMGGTPLFALALVGMPINVLPLETIKQILDGGESVCREAGIPIAGVTPSIRSSQSTVWSPSAWSTREISNATRAPSQATSSFSVSRLAWACCRLPSKKKNCQRMAMRQ